jgi:hypothetical protein
MEAANQILKALKNPNPLKPPQPATRPSRDIVPAAAGPMRPSDYSKPTNDAINAAATSYLPSQPTGSPKQELPPRISSFEDAKKAAEVAIGGPRPLPPQSQGRFSILCTSDTYTNVRQTLDLHSRNNLLFPPMIHRPIATSSNKGNLCLLIDLIRQHLKFLSLHLSLSLLRCQL